MALKVGELFASFNVDTSGVSSAVNSVEKQLSSIGKNLAIGGAAMTAAVTVPLKKAASEIYQAGSGFDAQMSKVFAIAGDSVTKDAKAMADLRAAALEMGSTTSFTASEAGEALQYMAMAGWKTQDMLDGLAPIMDLAAASGESLGTVSDIVTDALTAFGLTAADTAHFTDVLAAASSNSNTNVAIMGESFKYVAPLAGTLGYSVDDVAVALGLMANAGIKGSMAGTSLRQVLSNLISPTDTQAEAMKQLGISLYDSNGKVKDFSELMGDFRTVAQKSGIDMKALRQSVSELDSKLEAGTITEAEYNARIQDLTEGNGEFLQAVSDLAGARGLSGLLAIMNATDADFAKLVEAIDTSTGAAKRMSKVMLDNAQGDVTLFKSAVEGLEITLWGLAEGGFRKTVQEATKYVDAFRTADKATQKGTVLMATLAAATGPVMVGLGGVISILPKLAHTFAAVSGPAALLGMGLVALGAAAIDDQNTIGRTFIKSMTKAGSKVEQFGKKVKATLPKMTTNMKAFLGSINTGIKRGLPGMIDGASDILTTGISALAANMKDAGKVSQTLVSTLASGLKRNIPQLVPAAASLVTNLVSTLISNAPKVLDAGLTLFSTLTDSLLGLDWENIGTTLHDSIVTALSEIKTNFYTLVFGKEPTEEDLGDWGKLGSKLVETIKAGIKKASDGGKNLLGGLVLGNDYNPDDSWGTVAGKIWNKIVSEMGKLLTNAGDLIKGLVLGPNYTADASWADVATEIWKKIKSGFTTLKSNAKDLLGTIALGDDYKADDSWEKVGTALWGKIKTKLSTLASDAKDLIGTLVLKGEYTADTSWAKIGQAIWNKAKEKFSNLAKDAKSIIGTFALGEGYTADASWSDIGKAIWNKAKEGFDGMIKARKDFVGELVLGDDYTPDTTWGQIGTKIWQMAQSGFTTLAADAKSFVGKFALGDDYTADSSWADVGTAIFDTIGNTLSELAANAKELVAGLVFKPGDEGYNADPSWAQIGEKVWAMVISGITSGIDFVTSILTKIGTPSIDAKNISTTVTNAGTFVTNLVTQLLGGAITWGNQITNFAQQIADKMAGFGWSSLGDSLGKVVGNLVQAIVNAIPNALNTAGKALDVGFTLAGGIVDSIASAFKKFNPDLNVSGIVSGLVNNIADKIPKLFELGGKVLSAGAIIAQKLFSSISTALSDLDASGLAGTLGTAAADLLKNLLQNVGGLKDNGEVKTFLENLGQSIMDGMGALGKIVGGFVGKLLGYLFSKEGLRDIYNAGTTVLELILSGMNAGISGLLNFFGNAIDNILIELGVIDPEARAKSEESGRMLAAAMYAGLESELSESMQGETMMSLMDYVLTKGGQGTQFSGDSGLSQSLEFGLNAILGTALENAVVDGQKDVEKFRHEVFSGLLNSKANDYDFWKMLGIGTDINKDSFPHVGDYNEAMQDAIAEATKGYKFWTDYLEANVNMSDIMPEDLNFWGAFLDAYSTGDYDALMDLMTAQATELFGASEELQTATGQANAARDEAVEAAHKEIQGTAETVKAEVENVIKAADESANEFAKKGLAGAIADNTEAADAAALSLSDAVVQEFLLTMSEENGNTIGTTFVNAIIAVLEDGSLVTVATTLANDTYSAVSGILTESAGSGIGSNFGQGLVNGINSMIDDATAAAANLGSAAAKALSSAIQEGSPSKLTAETGRNFGLGFINSILSSASDASDAAVLVGRSAASALEGAVSDVQSMAANDMNLPVKQRRSEAEVYAAESEKAAQQYADAIARALDGARVVMDGEDVGRLVMPTVSEMIAAEAGSRRWGTE